jgi:hypothetical protein
MARKSCRFKKANLFGMDTVDPKKKTASAVVVNDEAEANT